MSILILAFSRDGNPFVVTAIGTCHVGKCISGTVQVILDSVAEFTCALILPKVTIFSCRFVEKPLPEMVTGCPGVVASMLIHVTLGCALIETLQGLLSTESTETIRS